MTRMNNSVNTFEKDPHHLEFFDGLFHVLSQGFFNIRRPCHRVKGRERMLYLAARGREGAYRFNTRQWRSVFFPTTLIHETTERLTTTVRDNHEKGNSI